MATHDYIISNASGAAVRADLNNALAAIVSNNSNATSPATTYAYQWWADTTTGQLKLRNSANSAWITIFELDGTMLMEDGTVSAPGLAFASDTNTGFFRSAADKINFATGGAERLEIGSSEVVFNDPSNDVNFRVESNGETHMLFVDAGNDRIGIGVTSPSRKLHLNSGSTDTAALFESSDANCQINFQDSTSAADGVSIGCNGDNFYIRSGLTTERMRIDGSGNLLIGRTSAGATGNGHTIRGGDSAIFSRDASGETVQICRNNTTGDLLQFRRNNVVCGEVVNNGATTVAYNTSSDYRLKENVVALLGGIDRVKELKPSRFNFIAEPEKTVDGFLAHEAQTVVPECATGVKDWVDEEGNPKMQGIDQSKLVPLLTAALQEAIAKIETLETKVAALEAG